VSLVISTSAETVVLDTTDYSDEQFYADIAASSEGLNKLLRAAELEWGLGLTRTFPPGAE